MINLLIKLGQDTDLDILGVINKKIFRFSNYKLSVQLLLINLIIILFGSLFLLIFNFYLINNDKFIENKKATEAKKKRKCLIARVNLIILIILFFLKL